MPCETCGEDVAYTSAETACGRDHCAECIAICRECMEDIADDIATERALDEWRGVA